MIFWNKIIKCKMLDSSYIVFIVIWNLIFCTAISYISFNLIIIYYHHTIKIPFSTRWLKAYGWIIPFLQ